MRAFHLILGKIWISVHKINLTNNNGFNEKIGNMLIHNTYTHGVIVIQPKTKNAACT